MDEEQGEADEAAGEGSPSLWKLVMSSGVLASMCCLPSVVLVMFGLASVSTAAALSDTLYWGPFRPILYGFTLIFIGAGLTFHFRSQGICTLDEAKQQRKRIKELERELQRKNAALAETAALLTLSKKARAIWGDEES